MITARNYSQYSTTAAPSVDAARPWRAIVHTAGGWIHVGDFATYRGANRATRNAIQTVGSAPVCARIGGTDRTYGAAWHVVDAPEDGRYWLHTEAAGCFDAEWNSRGL